MQYLPNLREVLKQHLASEYSRKEIQDLFLSSGFEALVCAPWRKLSLIEQFYSQRDWFQPQSSECLFPITFRVLEELQYSYTHRVVAKDSLQKQFARILVNGVRVDGAEYYPNNGVAWKQDAAAPAFRRPHSANALDFLFVTALTEEHQVLKAVLRRVCDSMGGSDSNILRYRYRERASGACSIAATCAYSMGAVSLGVHIAPILDVLKPKRAVLFGIAAAVDRTALALGDVPYASQVISLDNIAVQRDGFMQFRTEGFPTDPTIERGIGEIQTSARPYGAWQTACVQVIEAVVSEVNKCRRRKIKCPDNIDRPHILVGNTAGGPFLIRDADFQDALTKSYSQLRNAKYRFVAPAHPKLLSAEMEAHGFMRAAHQACIPASVIKGISDLGDARKAVVEKRTGGFYRAYACSNAVLALLHCLPGR